MNRLGLLARAVMVAAVVTVGTSSASAVHHSPAATCSAPFLVEQTFASGAKWTMCWEPRTLEGIVLHDITYTTPTGQEFLVLGQANLAEIHVPYDDNGARLHDETDGGLGGAHFADLTTADCPDGTRLPYNGKNVLCQSVESRGYSYKSYANSGQGQVLKLFSVSFAGEYNYIVEWNFGDDGSIEPRVGAAGALQRTSSNPAYGWPLGPGRYGVSHVHSYYWRLDFNLGGVDNNSVEQLDFAPDATREKWTLQKTPFVNETAASVSPTTFRSWRLVNTSVLNADGHPISYELQPNPAELFHGPTYEKFTKHELYVTVNKACEQFASHNPAIGGCATDVSGFVNNGQTLSGKDIVVWYGISFHHLPRDEDESVMDVHWTSFDIVPRDLTATNPIP